MHGKHKRAASGSGRHRPRASIACNNCRARKVKCDVQRLMNDGTCTRCRVSNVQCTVSHDDDRRRYGSYHHIAALKDRLQSLESMMTHHFRRTSEAASEQSPRPDEHERSSPSPAVPRPDSVPSSPCTYMSRTPSSHGAEPDHPLCTPATEFSAAEAEAPPAVTADSRLSWSEVPKLIGTPSNPNPSPRSIPSMPSGSMNNQHSLAQMTGEPAHGQLLCHGTDSSLGQARFYGSCTQLEMQSQPTEQDIGNETALNLDSSQVQKVLLEIAWRYLTLQTRLVHEQYFLSHRELGVRSQYYSKFLENTLLACASRASTSVTMRKLARPYIDRAVKDIPMELEYPTLATVQGFLLLADFEATWGRDRLGWTYMGIACRLLLFDLGWHDRCEPLATKDDLTSCDAQSRYTVYFSTFVYDTIWSLYLGRPRTISLPMLCATRGSIQHTVDNRILYAWVDLCVHIAEVSDIVNTPHSRTSQFMAQLLVLDSRIQNTYEALPLDLAYRQMSTAELDAAGYAYHMQFYSTKIVLHRALIKSSLGRETPLPESVPSTNGIFLYTPDSSSKNMYESAVRITELAVTYRQIFGLDKMITVMLHNMYMAAITLINHVLVLQRQGTQAESDIRRIRQLVDTLYQVQKHFPIAFRMCHTLSEILSGTSLAALVDCIPLSLRHTKPFLPMSAVPQVDSWGAMGTPVENNLSPQVSMDFNGVLDERYQPWIPDMGMTRLPLFSEPSVF